MSRRKSSPMAPREVVLVRLGSVAAPPSRTVDPLLTAEELTSYVRRHKCLHLARSRATVGDWPSALVHELCVADDRLVERERRLEPAIELIDGLARELGVTVFGLKGIVSRAMYPPGQRDVRDLDLMIDDAADAWRLADRLVAGAYAYDEREHPWLKRSADSGRYYGQILLVHEHDSLAPKLDIHFGGYSVRHCALLALDLPSRPAGFTLLPDEENIVCTIAAAAGDCKVTQKDLNDFVQFLRSGAEPDWPGVVDRLDRVGVLPFFAAFLERVRSWSDLNLAERDQVADLLARCPRRERLTPDGLGSRSNRWWNTTRHAADLRTAGPATRVGQAATAMVAYARPTAISVTSSWINRLARRRSNLPVRQWSCVRLVPIACIDPSGAAAAGLESARRGREQVAVGPLTWSRVAGAAVATCGGQHLLPTVGYRFDAGWLEAVRRT